MLLPFKLIPMMQGLAEIGLVQFATQLATTGFNPLSLFGAGEQGVWYDPSDTTTLFQDSAGTTPVTASGQPVGRMLDKSGRGNHATQPTAASRPIYRRGDSRGVVNLLTWSEDFGNAVWAKGSSSISADSTLAPDGTMTADKLVMYVGVDPTTTNNVGITNFNRADSGTSVSSLSFFAKAGEVSSLRVRENISSGAFLTVDLVTGAITNGNSTQFGSPSAVNCGNGWWRISFTTAIGSTSGSRFGLRANAVGDGTSGIYIWGAQLNLDPTALPYQRNDSRLGGVATGASTDLHWLETDGVDDGMVTGNIDFTGTDKVAVFSGINKLSGSAAGAYASTLSDGSPAGQFELSAPRTTTPLEGYLVTRAGGFTQMSGPSYVVPEKAVSSISFDHAGALPGDIIKVRKNGQVLAVSLFANSGTSTKFGNYPLYLFRRGGKSLPFNGWFYGLAITGRLATDAETVATERYLAAKSAVVIP